MSPIGHKGGHGSVTVCLPCIRIVRHLSVSPPLLQAQLCLNCSQLAARGPRLHRRTTWSQLPAGTGAASRYVRADLVPSTPLFSEGGLGPEVPQNKPQGSLRPSPFFTAAEAAPLGGRGTTSAELRSWRVQAGPHLLWGQRAQRGSRSSQRRAGSAGLLQAPVRAAKGSSPARGHSQSGHAHRHTARQLIEWLIIPGRLQRPERFGARR
ncbi:hypothetical protein NDU88_003085 [Pleurodeles waltl]|uniref:Uncharacterized protein n=1 Tax=Pleurodeles waltl TaxID=8319 RepID=A0AAV7UXG9_PLEWA|nr:hypothetical protein NDU88_003085 [Pleurodeles waltl]